jgi:predicted secreted protein
VTGVYTALAGDGTSSTRRVFATVVVVALALFAGPMLLAAFILGLMLVGKIAGTTPPLVGRHPIMSWGAVAIVLALFLGFAAALVVLSRRSERTRDPHEEEEDEEGVVADAAPPRPRDRRALLRTALEAALFVAVALVLMWPLSFRLSSAFAGWKDSQYYVWLMWRVGQMLRDGVFSTHISGVVWPYGIDIRLLDGQGPTLIGGLWNVVAGPYLAYNLGLMTGTLLNLWAGRRLGRLFSERRAVWVLTAIAFATAPSIAARLEVHFTLYYAFPTALLVEEAIRVARGDRPLRPLRLGILLFVAYLCGIYQMIFGAIAFALIVLFSVSALSALPRLLLKAAAGAGVALLLMSPFLAARLEADRQNRATGHGTVLLGNTLVAEADALSIVAQPSSSTFDLPGAARLRRTFRQNVHESTIFPGFLAIASLAGLLLLRTRLRWPALVATLGTWLLALGSSLKIDGVFSVTGTSGAVAWLPYAALMRSPGLGSLRSPNRASFALAALMVAPVGLSLDWLLRRFPRVWQQGIVIGAAMSMLATNLLIPISESTVPGGASMQAGLREVAARAQPGQSMVGVPADCETWAIVFQIEHHAPFVGCNTSRSAIPWAELSLYRDSSALAALRCNPRHIGELTTRFTQSVPFGPEDLLALARDLGVRFFLVDLGRLRAARCADVRERVLPVLMRYELLGADGGWMIIDTGSLAPATPRSG